MEHLTLRTKLIGGFLLMALITLLVGYGGLSGLLKVTGHLQNIENKNMPGIENLLIINRAQAAIKASELALLNQQLDTQRQRQYQIMDRAWKDVKQAWKIYAALHKTEQEQRLWMEFIPAWNSWQDDMEQFINLSRKLDATKILRPEQVAKELRFFQSELHGWVLKLATAILTPTQFTEKTDLHETTFGQWLGTFRLDNPVFTELQGQLIDQTKALLYVGKKVHRRFERGTDVNSIYATSSMFRNKLLRILKKIDAIYIRMNAEIKKAVTLYAAMNTQAFSQNASSYNAAEDILLKLVAENKLSAEQSEQLANEDTSRAVGIAMGGMALGTLIALLLGVGLSLSIIKPLKQVSMLLNKVAKGSLTATVPDLLLKRKDEIGQLLSDMVQLITAMEAAAQVAEAIAAGDLALEVHQRSTDDRLMQALQRMVHSLSSISQETTRMIDAVHRGDLAVQGNSEAFDGGWRYLINGINSLISAMGTAISEATAIRHEMDMARRIQTALLPGKIRTIHPDFEIAAEMLACDEVGGDYYDITFDQKGMLWFGIGDVSGHGVTPGLIMMMAQTAHTAITTNYHVSAQEVVVQVNTVLYKNVHGRLLEDHFMTFTALKYLGHGKFQHAGAHLSMIVFRRKNGACEFIRTKGVYLNFKKDISRATKNAEFCLDVGDILILYTDGLTEAENQDEKMLDIRGLTDSIEKHAHKDVEEMKQMIMADVLSWCNNKRADDMTLVIVKRKAD